MFISLKTVSTLIQHNKKKIAQISKKERQKSLVNASVKSYFTQIRPVLQYCLYFMIFEAFFTSPVNTYGRQCASFSLEHQYKTIPLSVVCIFDICNN